MEGVQELKEMEGMAGEGAEIENQTCGSQAGLYHLKRVKSPAPAQASATRAVLSLLPIHNVEPLERAPTSAG